LEPAQASQPDFQLECVELKDVVNVSSCDTEAASELLTLESGREISSRPSLGDVQEPLSSFSAGSELFED
jgi:hypothetical protein